MVTHSVESPSRNVDSSAQRVLHIDSTDSAKVTQSEEQPKQIDDVTSNEKSPDKGHVAVEEHTRTLINRLGSLELRNPPYSLPNGYRIAERAVLDEGDTSAQLIQSALISSELQTLVEMPAVDLGNQGYCYLAKFLHCHSASIVRAQGLQIKHQEQADELKEMKSHSKTRSLWYSYLMSSNDLKKAKEEKVKLLEKIINWEGELQLLRSENVDLKILFEDAHKAAQNAATTADANASLSSV